MARSARSIADGRRRRGRRGADDLGHDPSGLDAALRADADRSGFIAAGSAVDDRGGDDGGLPAGATRDARRPDGGATLRIGAVRHRLVAPRRLRANGRVATRMNRPWVRAASGAQSWVADPLETRSALEAGRA